MPSRTLKYGRDFSIVRGISPHIYFTRSETLAGAGSSCTERPRTVFSSSRPSRHDPISTVSRLACSLSNSPTGPRNLRTFSPAASSANCRPFNETVVGMYVRRHTFLRHVCTSNCNTAETEGCPRRSNSITARSAVVRSLVMTIRFKSPARTGDRLAPVRTMTRIKIVAYAFTGLPFWFLMVFPPFYARMMAFSLKPSISSGICLCCTIPSEILQVSLIPTYPSATYYRFLAIARKR